MSNELPVERDGAMVVNLELLGPMVFVPMQTPPPGRASDAERLELRPAGVPRPRRRRRRRLVFLAAAASDRQLPACDVREPDRAERDRGGRVAAQESP